MPQVSPLGAKGESPRRSGRWSDESRSPIACSLDSASSPDAGTAWPMTSLLLLELNEINFDFVRRYTGNGHLPTLATLIERHGISQTTSERSPDALEPWIQWVTAHCGKTLAEHGVFRLGDIVHHDLPQIWEMLEERGVRVGAISPMNAKLRAKAPAFFVPDPWTETGIEAPRLLKNLFAAVRQSVNDNAQGTISAASVAALIAGVARYARLTNVADYGRLTLRSIGNAWRRAIVLDLLLADVFIAEVRRTRPGFASLFLNAGAHIQHHYMFCSDAYRGSLRNPGWYIRKGVDPVLEVYRQYDRIVADILRTFPESRVMIATGLHQEPHEHVTYYWRLRRHAELLRRIGVDFTRVEPRMSRDFLVAFADRASAAAGAERLTQARTADGTPLFEVDNRGADAFVMLTYAKEIDASFEFFIGTERYTGLRDDVAFVAIKNGEHDGTGYFIDTGMSPQNETEEFPLAQLPRRILDAFATREFAARPAGSGNA
jgi:hypothetical protein